jgi:hypothetical protein
MRTVKTVPLYHLALAVHYQLRAAEWYKTAQSAVNSQSQIARARWHDCMSAAQYFSAAARNIMGIE